MKQKENHSSGIQSIDFASVKNPVGDAQRRPIFRHKRGGVVLTRQQVKAIKRGRKQLRKDMRKRGLKRKEDFNLMASSMGLYFDQGKGLLYLRWFLHGRGLWVLAGAVVALMGVLFLYSTITQLRGHFTINMSDGMFREGFVLSETEDFQNATTQLFCAPALDIPCISISHIPADIDDYEGQHNENYFAYTFFLRNEGESTVDYTWSIDLNSESRDLSEACWLMVFEDGEMQFYAAPNENGKAEALPAFGDDSRGYLHPKLRELCRDPEEQYPVIMEKGSLTYYRIVPVPFVSDTTVFASERSQVAPAEVHKYTVVIWLEGDDPDCTDELIGGHVGMEVNMRLVSEEGETTDGSGAAKGHWDSLLKSLKFWKT